MFNVSTSIVAEILRCCNPLHEITVHYLGFQETYITIYNLASKGIGDLFHEQVRLRARAKFQAKFHVACLHESPFLCWWFQYMVSIWLIYG